MRLMIYQSGDYAEAAQRFANGGDENYYAQRYSVDFVASLAPQLDDVTMFCFGRDYPEIRLANGVRCIGVKLYRPGQRTRHLAVLRELDRLRPDHLVVCSPQRNVIGWGLLRGVRMLPMFADSFQSKNLRDTLKHKLLVAMLNSKRIDWVSNHNIAASLDLARIGVSPEKVLPFDWPAFVHPRERLPKQPPTGNDFKIAYVGAVTESKGVGDLIETIGLLNAAGNPPLWRATIVGKHDGNLERRATELGLAEFITFRGPIPHGDILPLMSDHDVVVVPSRHDYPEGLPMTIYEGICSRTPLVVSDHPMFKLKLRDNETALIFPAGRPDALANQLQKLQQDPDLYTRLSVAADTAAQRYLCPLKYHELISRWLSGRDDDREILSSFSLATDRYTSS